MIYTPIVELLSDTEKQRPRTKFWNDFL